MRGRVADIQRFCMHDGPGIRTVVFLQGCPLRCSYCHNPQMQAEKGGRDMTVEEVMAEVERDMPFYRASGGGLTLSGGEPLMQPVFCEALIASAKNKSISTCIETSGAAPIETIKEICAQADFVLWDIKAAEEGATLPVEKLLAIGEAGVNISLRSVLLPGADQGALQGRLLAASSFVPQCEMVEMLPYNELASNSFIQAMSASTPSSGMAL